MTLHVLSKSSVLGLCVSDKTEDFQISSLHPVHLTTVRSKLGGASRFTQPEPVSGNKQLESLCSWKETSRFL